MQYFSTPIWIETVCKKEFMRLRNLAAEGKILLISVLFWGAVAAWWVAAGFGRRLAEASLQSEVRDAVMKKVEAKGCGEPVRNLDSVSSKSSSSR